MTNAVINRTDATKARVQSVGWVGTSQAVTISSGAVTVDNYSILVVAAESGTADDLDTITLTDSAGDSEGLLVVVVAATGDTITVKDGTGNISTGADVELSPGDTLWLVYYSGSWRSQVSSGGSSSGSGSSGVEAMYIATSDAAVTNSSTEGTLIGTGIGTLTAVGDGFGDGSTYRITARGYHKRTSGTLAIDVNFGSTVLTTGAITLTSAASSTYFEVSALITVRLVGSSGTLYSQGIARFGDDVYPMLETAERSVDTTSDKTIDVTATWSIANADNTITCTNVLVESFATAGVEYGVLIDVPGYPALSVVRVGALTLTDGNYISTGVSLASGQRVVGVWLSFGSGEPQREGVNESTGFYYSDESTGIETIADVSQESYPLNVYYDSANYTQATIEAAIDAAGVAVGGYTAGGTYPASGVTGAVKIRHVTGSPFPPGAASSMLDAVLIIESS